MTESGEPSGDIPKPGTALIEAGGATAGAAIGLALGGPVGALIGAASGPLATFGVRHFTALASRYFSQIRMGLQRKQISESEFLAIVEGDEAKRGALAALLLSVSQVSDPNQIDFLANATIALIDANDRSSGALRELATMAASLSPLQLKMLRFIADHCQSGPVTPDSILKEFELETPLIRAVVRNLEHFGLIVDEARLDPRRKGVFWVTTELGEWIVRLWAPSANKPSKKSGTDVL